MTSVGVEVETEEGFVANDGKNVVEGATSAKSVMEANFGDTIRTTIPTDENWFDFGVLRVVDKGNRNWRVNFEMHKIV